MQKIKKHIKAYCDFLDNKLSDTTIIVGIIWVLIVGVWYIGKTDASYYKASTFDQWFSLSKDENIVYIDGKPYKLHFEAVK